MGVVANRNKGLAYEREIAKSLSLWLSRGEAKDWFCRSQASGAMATREPGEWNSQAGDIAATGIQGAPLTETFLIECKRWKVFGLGSLIYRKSNLMSVWYTAVKQSVQATKLPMLIAREDKRKTIVVVDEYGFALLKTRCGLACLAHFPYQNMHFFSFEDLMQLDPSVFLAHLGKVKQ